MKLSYIYILIALFSFSSCIKQVDIDVDPGEKFMYVDAFITNQTSRQQVVVNHSAPYLGNSTPGAVTNAQVVLKNITKNRSHTFQYLNGLYIYHPTFPLVSVGDSVVLEVTVDGVLYTASDKMNRVPTIDSVTLHYKAQSLLYEEGIYGEVHIKDLPGATDYYWLKTNYNSDDPREGNNLAIDGGYYEDLFDGLEFITPLREAINEYGPFESGGRIDVRLRSLSKQTYSFLEMLFNVSSGSGMFAEILKNVPTNIKTPENEKKMLGWFATTAERSVTIFIP
jgi:hypothetical protein